MRSKRSFFLGFFFNCEREAADRAFTVDAYRNKMRSTMVAAGHDVASVAPHFETRVGKRKWMERSKRAKREEGSAGSP